MYTRTDTAGQTLLTKERMNKMEWLHIVFVVVGCIGVIMLAVGAFSNDKQIAVLGLIATAGGFLATIATAPPTGTELGDKVYLTSGEVHATTSPIPSEENKVEEKKEIRVQIIPTDSCKEEETKMHVLEFGEEIIYFVYVPETT